MAKTVRLLTPPEGFRYEENFITPAEETALVHGIEKLPLKEFEFQGYLAKRRTKSFGWHYSFESGSLHAGEAIPEFLLQLREKAAEFAGLGPEDFSQVLVTEYSPGTPIGWHRDKAVFGDVAGVSLLSACPFRLRRRTAAGWERYTATLEPRSVYILSGAARDQWEHSIPAVESLRYSVTFRSLRTR